MSFVGVGRVGQNFLVTLPDRVGLGGDFLRRPPDRVRACHERVGNDLHRVGDQAGDLVLEFLRDLFVRVLQTVGLGALVLERVRNDHRPCADQCAGMRGLLFLRLFRFHVVEVVGEQHVAHRPV